MCPRVVHFPAAGNSHGVCRRTPGGATLGEDNVMAQQPMDPVSVIVVKR
jgi:hypothetical protein